MSVETRTNVGDDVDTCGELDGDAVSGSVGELDGDVVSDRVGVCDGELDGELIGKDVGDLVGENVGDGKVVSSSTDGAFVT